MTHSLLMNKLVHISTVTKAGVS